LKGEKRLRQLIMIGLPIIETHWIMGPIFFPLGPFVTWCAREPRTLILCFRSFIHSLPQHSVFVFDFGDICGLI